MCFVDRVASSVPLNGWRRIASAMWSAPNDPLIHGQIDVDAAPMSAFLDRARARGHALSPTHVVGRAVACALDRVPDLNVRIAHGRAYPRPTVDVFFVTAVGDVGDLSGVKIARASKKSVYEIAAELDRRAKQLEEGEDPGFARSKRLMDALPEPLLGAALRLSMWLAATHAVSVPVLGIEACPFGGAMVTSVGVFGLPAGFSPIARMCGVPLLVTVGELADTPACVDGRVVVRRTLPIGATIDHRFVDGRHVGRAMDALREYLAAPERFEPDLARLEDSDADRPSVPPSRRVS